MIAHAALHLAAFSLMVLAVVVHPGIRHRACVPDVVAGVCMVVAMVDALWLRALPVVYSMALLLAAAIATAAIRSVRARRAPGAGRGACESSHAPLGFVATAVCLPSMHGMAAAGASHAQHGLGAGAFTATMLAICGGHLLVSAVAARRASSVGERAHYVLMGAGTALMALAAL